MTTADIKRFYDDLEREDRRKDKQDKVVKRILRHIVVTVPIVVGDRHYDMFAGCWIWTGAYSTKRLRGITQHRRPVIRVGKRVIHVLRLTLLWRIEDDIFFPRTGYHACHNPKGLAGCEDTRCVNPWHAHWCTPQENAAHRRKSR